MERPTMNEFKDTVTQDVRDQLYESRISALQSMQPSTESIDVSRDMKRGNTRIICGTRGSTQALHHGRLVLSRWDRLLDLVKNSNGRQVIAVDGESLDLASVLAVARYVLVPILTSQV